MKTTQYQRTFLLAILSFFISIGALNKAIAADMPLPQQAILEASDKLKEKLQNPSFIVITHPIFIHELVYKIKAGNCPSKSRVSAAVAETSFFRQVDR